MRRKFTPLLFQPKNRVVDYPKNEKFTKCSKLTERFEHKKRRLLFYKQTPIGDMLVLFVAQAENSVRIISCLENGGKLRNEFPIEVIHAAAVHAVRLGIFADGLALDIPFLEIRAVVLENGFETVVQKGQVLFENIEFFLLQQADIPFLRHAQPVSAQIGFIVFAKVFSVVGIGLSRAKAAVFVCKLFLVLRFLPSDGAAKAAAFQILYMRVRNPDLRLTGELIYPFAVHLYRFAEGFLCHAVIFTFAGVDPLVEDDHLLSGIRIGNNGYHIDEFAVVPPVEAGEYSSVALSHMRPFLRLRNIFDFMLSVSL